MQLLSISQMANELGTTREGVYARMKRGQLPAPMRIGDTPFWRKEDWIKWLDLQARKQGVAIEIETNKTAEPLSPRRGRPRNQ